MLSSICQWLIVLSYVLPNLHHFGLQCLTDHSVLPVVLEFAFGYFFSNYRTYLAHQEEPSALSL